MAGELTFDGTKVFAEWYGPPPRLFVYGAVDTAEALARGAKLLGWTAIVADARAKREEMKGAIVLAPPSAIADRWSRRMPDALTSFASGWMRVRARSVSATPSPACCAR